LSFETDKLPAISGLAAAAVAGNKGEDFTYLAGVWKESFIRDFMWSAYGPRKPAPFYRAPTFSWASMDSYITYTFGVGSEEDYVADASLIDFQIDNKGYNPFGEVIGGFVVLKCPVVEVTLRCNSPLLELITIFNTPYYHYLRQMNFRPGTTA
jgi:hypothetical protein